MIDTYTALEIEDTLEQDRMIERMAEASELALLIEDIETAGHSARRLRSMRDRGAPFDQAIIDEALGVLADA